MQKVSWRKNWEICCSLGMTPLTLDSASEQQCLSKVTTDKDWKGNFNYWSGGTQQDCRGSWGWCAAGAAPKFVSDELKWEPGQPDNLSGREDCMHLKNFVMAGMLMLTDRNCTDRYIFACKVQIVTHAFFLLGHDGVTILFYRENPRGNRENQIVQQLLAQKR
jgi:Lectin C-type domain